MVRAKMCLRAIERLEFAPGRVQTTLKFQTAYDPEVPEDQRFCKATPGGQLSLLVDNPAALAKFEAGKTYYLDFTPAS